MSNEMNSKATEHLKSKLIGNKVAMYPPDHLTGTRSRIHSMTELHNIQSYQYQNKHANSFAHFYKGQTHQIAMDIISELLI